MALLQPLLVYKDGDSHRVGIYRVNGATAGDTIDVGADFKKITMAAALQLTSQLADFVLTTSVTGTVVTINGTGLALDAVVVVIVGSAL